tara:strand:- start:1265 stop:2017 length:753 start_codon:yes stop_codon:yes gene_type:complete
MSLELLEEKNDIFGGTFNEWRKKRVGKVEEIFGKNWFKEKSVLEVAAGFGNIGFYLQTLGADVTFTDCRNECIDEIKRKDINAKTYTLDHDTKWEIPPNFDMVIHFGLSYNLYNWKRDLKCSLNQTKKYMVYETAVNKFKEDISFSINLNNSPTGRVYGHEYHGPANPQGGSLPSVSAIEKEFERNRVEYQRFDDINLNIDNLIYTNPCDSNFIYPKDSEGNTLPEPYEIDSFDNEYVSGNRKFWVLTKP